VCVCVCVIGMAANLHNSVLHFYLATIVQNIINIGQNLTKLLQKLVSTVYLDTVY